MDNQRKGHIGPKRPKQRNRPKQLQTHNLPSNDVENTNSTNKGRDLLLANRLFPEEQKGWRKGCRGTAELLSIDQHSLEERKTRRKNLTMAWIDYKKAYDMVLQS